MFYSAAGGGVIIALMALLKIRIGTLGLSPFLTSLSAGFNYGIGFMIIHMLHCTVATKQPAMTAASFAEQVDLNEGGKAVDNKLAKLLIDVCRSQSVAVFGNVSIAILLACAISFGYAHLYQQPILDAHTAAYQFKSIDIIAYPTLWYAAIAGLWLFCSGIIAGFSTTAPTTSTCANACLSTPCCVKSCAPGPAASSPPTSTNTTARW